MHILKVLANKCTGCGICEVACSQYNTGEASPNKSAIQVFRKEESAAPFPLVIGAHITKTNRMSEPINKVYSVTILGRLMEEAAVAMLCEAECEKAVCCDLCAYGALQVIEEEMSQYDRRQASYAIGESFLKMKGVK